MTTNGIDRDTRDAVQDVLIGYAVSIDSRNWPALRGCFTDDCDADYGEIGHWRSGEEITEWMARTHDPMGPTLHRITNIALTGPGDDGVVRARSYVDMVLGDGAGSLLLRACGYYDDELVQQAGGGAGSGGDAGSGEGGPGWRIARRRFVSVAMGSA